MGLPTQRFRNMRLVGAIKQDRDELVGPAAGIVESLGDERAFPIHTFAFGGDFLSEEPAAVVFRADAHDMRGRVETVHHPPRPAFGRRAFFNVAVKDGRNPIGAKAFGQTEHPLAVGVGIVAVADEDGDFAHRWSKLRLSEDDVFRVSEFFFRRGDP